MFDQSDAIRETEMIRVVAIREGDYGCEERPEGAPLMCNVEIEKDGEKIYFNIPDKTADELGLEEKAEITSSTFSKIEDVVRERRLI